MKRFNCIVELSGYRSGLDRSDHDAITSVTNATTLNSNLPLAGYETLVDITEVEEVVEFSEKRGNKIK